MKKKNLKNLSLNKKSVSALTNEDVKGGNFSYGSPICNTQEPEFCNWTYNRWCYNTGSPGICTAPK
ncbi:hypothetical protein [uncultured Kordia sp.]|uniref:hypothetical protein n=1 Tax=uncultured Kordia sp. TaxID=507699 RepID=UPI00261659B7|nr:hypothetical protein [uncultured Kordia sp.]